MGTVGATTDDVTTLRADFAAELLRRRMIARLSQGALATLMGYDRTYVNKVERGAIEPTVQFARKADDTLEACGGLLRRWESLDEVRSRQHPSRSLNLPAEEAAADLVIQHDEAWLTYVGDAYSLRMRKRIANVGKMPVTRFFIRIAVDRYPNDPRSNEWHREHPLTLDELQLHAFWGEEPMSFEIKQDRDATKELWLLFQNEHSQFPLYPGEEAAIEYGYCVATVKWGQWFQRAVRLPTGWLGVHLAFPAGLDPSVWGVETSHAAGERPFIAPINYQQHSDTTHFHWSTTRPPLAARYRLEWTFRTQAD